MGFFALLSLVCTIPAFLLKARLGNERSFLDGESLCRLWGFALEDGSAPLTLFRDIPPCTKTKERRKERNEMKGKNENVNSYVQSMTISRNARVLYYRSHRACHY